MGVAIKLLGVVQRVEPSLTLSLYVDFATDRSLLGRFRDFVSLECSFFDKAIPNRRPKGDNRVRFRS